MPRDERFLAVAQAIANARYPLSVDPEPQEVDYEEARRFIAAFDAIMAFPVSEKPSWSFLLADMERDVVGED